MIGREKEKIINRDDKGVGWVGPLVQWYPIFFFLGQGEIWQDEREQIEHMARRRHFAIS